MLKADEAALVLAPMDGITDAAMRAFQGSLGGFSFAVSEFIRVSIEPIPAKVFRRDVPELCNGGLTSSGLPVQVQLLGGDPGRMAKSAFTACQVGAQAIDINFGCPAPTVNRHDGGASLLQHPCRIREVVKAVREAVPTEIPVSAKLRLGWDSIDSIDENAAMAAEGGASWLTIHARTRQQGYAPPVHWKSIGRVRKALDIPVMANGDIWNLDDFHQCEDETGCRHFMIGRGALANPALPHQIAGELGIGGNPDPLTDWEKLFRGLTTFIDGVGKPGSRLSLTRLKQWINLAHKFGNFPYFHELKRSENCAEFFELLEVSINPSLEENNRSAIP
jgi:tRNA-dihydrouridine synthase C